MKPEDIAKSAPDGESREAINKAFKDAALRFELQDARFMLVDPSDRILAAYNSSTMTPDPVPQASTGYSSVDDRFGEALKNSYLKKSAFEEAPPGNDPIATRGRWLVGYAQVPFPGVDRNAQTGHAFSVLVTQPVDVAYATIYSNQAWIGSSSRSSSCSRSSSASSTAAGSSARCTRSSRSPSGLQEGQLFNQTARPPHG